MSTSSHTITQHVISPSTIANPVVTDGPTAAEVTAGFCCIKPGDFIPETPDVLRDDTSGLEEDSKEVETGANPLHQNFLVPQMLVKVPSISNISDVVRACGTCKQTALSCLGHPVSDIHYDCGRPTNDCTCYDQPCFILPPPTPQYVNVPPPHCVVLDPAMSWGVHTCTIALNNEDSNKENQDSLTVSGPVDEGISFTLRRTCHVTLTEQQRAQDKANTPDSFELNIPPQFIPFRLTIGGQQVVAKYIHLMPGNNPIIYGCMEKGGEIQQGEVHAAPDFDTDGDCDYTHDQLHYPRKDYGDHHRVDLAMVEIPDRLLWAEVSRYHHMSQQYKDLAKAIKALDVTLLEFALELLEFAQELLEFAQELLEFAQELLEFALELLDFSPKLLEFALELLEFAQELLQLPLKLLELPLELLKYAPKLLKFALELLEFAPKLLEFALMLLESQELLEFPLELQEFPLELLEFCHELLEFALELLEFALKLLKSQELLEFAPDLLELSLELLEFPLELQEFSPELLVFPLKLLVFAPELWEFALVLLVFALELLVFALELLVFALELLVFAPELLESAPEQSLHKPNAVATLNTKDGWDFVPYRINSRERDAPTRYLVGRVRWRHVPDTRRTEENNTGYYAEAATSQRFHPVVSNRERCCWVELRWSNTNSYFEATRPAADDLNINIPLVDARPIDQQGVIDGQEEEQPDLDTEPPRTEFQLRTTSPPQSSHTSERLPTPRSEGEPEEIAVQSPEVDALAAQTAELHIPEPIRGIPYSYMTTQTEVSPPRLVINEQTGHVQQLQPEDMEAVNRAMGPDVPDAPSIPEGTDMFYEFRLNRNRIPSPDNRPFPPLQRPPGGGQPGGGKPRGGPPQEDHREEDHPEEGHQEEDHPSRDQQ
ncbi:hypothetical protein EI94DRAFT_1803184 [Lactarius quietus]|nr:hypothetical protein EI94DRAFT_1803184 [Lactarius quietus]